MNKIVRMIFGITILSMMFFLYSCTFDEIKDKTEEIIANGVVGGELIGEEVKDKGKELLDSGKDTLLNALQNLKNIEPKVNINFTTDGDNFLEPSNLKVNNNNYIKFEIGAVAKIPNLPYTHFNNTVEISFPKTDGVKVDYVEGSNFELRENDECYIYTYKLENAFRGSLYENGEFSKLRFRLKSDKEQEYVIKIVFDDQIDEQFDKTVNLRFVK